MTTEQLTTLLQLVNTGGTVALLMLWVASFASGKIVPGSELVECRRRADRYLRQLLACRLGKDINLDDDDDVTGINGQSHG